MVVRLTIERMEQQILQAISPEQLSKEIGDSIQKAIGEFDFHGEVRKHVHAALSRHVAHLVEDEIADKRDELAEACVKFIQAAISQATVDVQVGHKA
jgi:hypothetical protein